MKPSMLAREVRACRFKSLLSVASLRQSTSRNYSSTSEDLKNFKASNEPILDYAKNSPERGQLERKLNEFLENASKIRNDRREALFEVPIVIGDKELRTSRVRYQLVPFDHSTRLCKFYHADKLVIKEAIENSLMNRTAWESSSVEYRASIFLKAAEKLATSKRADLLAATMLGQGKTVFQAEIDAACELVDFLRFNVQFLFEALKYKPQDVANHTINNMHLRGLEGFVAAVAPFNFTAISGNLASAPALMGNVVIWKPSDTAVFASYLFYKLLRECGLPAGVINFVPADGPDFGEAITSSSDLAGVNFTGSVATFRWIWKSVANKLEVFKTFPRLSGECGGKNFHLVHPSADMESVAVSTVRSAFEYSGQKCSACSRLYVPKSKWLQLKERLRELVAELKVGSPLDFTTFTSAVIDERSFDRIASYIDQAKKNHKISLVFGGDYDKSKGYFIQPTLFETTDPNDKLMREEIFGPVLTAFVFNDAEFEKCLDLVDKTTPYALTGAIFAQDESVIERAQQRLRQSCGNMYINDKSTGAVVNQQPFGGARLSGTNDKPGGPHNLLRWTSPLSVKRYNLPNLSVRHASML